MGELGAKELKIRGRPEHIKGFKGDANTATFTHINNSVENGTFFFF